VVQQHVLYLGEVINRQRVSWERAVSVFDETSSQLRQLSLIPRGSSDQRRGGGHVVGAAERTAVGASATVGLAGGLPVAGMRLDTFFAERLGCIREDTPWEKVLRALTIYRLLSPGSEWRLHRQRFATTALPDLLDTDASVAQTATRYRCHDRLLEHKEALFAHLRERWTDLFAPSFDILLYDLTSTYFECDVPEDENDPRKFGYSRDRRGDCMQVVIALVVTPEGLPLAYEMLPGKTAAGTAPRGSLGGFAVLQIGVVALDRGFIGLHVTAFQQVGLHELDQRFEERRGQPDPVAKILAGDRRAPAGEHLLLTMERKMIGVLGGEHPGDQTGGGEAAGGDPRGRETAVDRVLVLRADNLALDDLGRSDVDLEGSLLADLLVKRGIFFPGFRDDLDCLPDRQRPLRRRGFGLLDGEEELRLQFRDRRVERRGETAQLRVFLLQEQHLLGGKRDRAHFCAICQPRRARVPSG